MSVRLPADYETWDALNQIWKALRNISGVPKPWPNVTVHLSCALWDRLSTLDHPSKPVDRICQTLFGTPVTPHDGWDEDRVELIIRIPLEEQ